MLSPSFFPVPIFSAGEEDLPALEDFYKVLEKPEEGYFSACLQRGCVIYAAKNLENSADIVGACVLNPAPRYALYRRLGFPEIQDVNVLRTFRRKGIASALLETCEAAAKATGHENIGISVGLTRSYGEAQRLYINRGYRPDGYGITYDRETVEAGSLIRADDNLCLMLLKNLAL